MPGDAVHALEGLGDWSSRVRSIADRSTKLVTLRDQISDDLAQKEGEVETLSVRLEVLSKVGELFRALMDLLVFDQVKSIEGVVTEGLRSIFFDQELAFEAEVSVRYNKIAIDFLIRQGEDGPLAIKGSPLESFGGGPSSIASLVLRVLTLIRLKRKPILMLDETLAAISDEYIDQASLFLRRLAETTGIDILLVTHKQGFLEQATVAYQGIEVPGDDGTWELDLRRLKGAK